MYKFAFFVPEDHKEVVKAAVFQAGAGRMGEYECCCWEVAGQGQFRPMAGANPFIGELGKVEKVTEYRVEMVVAEELVKAVVAAMKQAHPYEEPAYDVWQLAEL